MRIYVHNAGLCQERKVKEAYWAQVARFSFLINVGTQIITLLVMDDVTKLFECFSVFTFCCMAVLKLNSLRKWSKEWLSVLKQAQELEEDYTSSTHHVDIEYESEDELVATDSLVEPNIESYRSKFRSNLTFIARLYIFTLFIFILSPFIEYEYWTINYVEIKEYPHVFPGWVSLDNFGLAGYVVTIVFEIIAAVYCVVIHLVFDATSVGLMIYLSGQFALLRERSAKIGGGGKDCQLTPARDSRAHYRMRSLFEHI